MYTLWSITVIHEMYSKACTNLWILMPLGGREVWLESIISFFSRGKLFAGILK